MDSYLLIAQKVLERARTPLTPRQILREAYGLGLVPEHLRGATQHKTLQARLSEHILDFRESALFFRTEPGKFFLSGLLNDESIPAEFRRPIVARRRIRELRRRDVLAVPKKMLPLQANGTALPAEALQRPIASHDYHYAIDLAHRVRGDVLVWSFIVVLRNAEVLTYRQGRYREDRDAFFERRSLGFYAPVVKSDRNLFDQANHGLVASALDTLAFDLDLIGNAAWSELTSKSELQSFVYFENGQRADLLGVVRLNCPSWFEPLTRRLAINDLTWQDLTTPANHIEDYDPWSQIVFHQAQRWAMESSENNGANRAGGD